MPRSRLEAFSDGVLAVVITIMVLELKVPRGAGIHALSAVLPHFLVYVFSFLMVAIYWNNHHHLLQATRRVNGQILWANLHLLFWLSLVPASTAWLGEHPRSTAPSALYGGILLLCSIAYFLLERAIIAENGKDSAIARAVGSERKELASVLLYSAGVGLAFVSPWLCDGLMVVVALLWLVPDVRIERLTRRSAAPPP